MNIRRNIGSHSPNTVASFPNYSSAQTAINKLSDEGFPVQYTSIIADELQPIRRSKDRFGWLKSTGSGLLNGLVIGALLGFFLEMFNLMSPMQSTIAIATNGAAFGAIIGALYGLIAGLFFRKKKGSPHNFTFTAQYYDVIVDEQYAHQALNILEDNFDVMKRPGKEVETRTFAMPPPSLMEAEHPHSSSTH